MDIYDDIDGSGRTIVILEKKDGQALVQALEFATARQDELRTKKALRKSSHAYKVASEIEQKLPVY